MREGDLFRVPDLDQSFELIAERGADEFYRGDLAKTIADDSLANGGLITRDDLAKYEAKVRTPLTIESAGYHLALNPPPAVGGTALASLIRFVESRWRPGMDDGDFARLLTDAEVNLSKLRHGKLKEADFDMRSANDLIESVSLACPNGNPSSPNTTHLSVAGSDGSLVAITLSMGYGAGITIPGAGHCHE